MERHDVIKRSTGLRRLSEALLLGTAVYAGGAVAGPLPGSSNDAVVVPASPTPAMNENEAAHSSASYPSTRAYYDEDYWDDDDDRYGDDHIDMVGGSNPGLSEEQEFSANRVPGQINAQAAYAQGISGAGVTVAVIDEDFDLDHPDLAPNIVDFEDVTLGNRAGQQNPDNEEIADLLEGLDGLIESNIEGGHGTNVSGVVAASRNGQGIQGVAPNAQILAIRADTHNIEEIEDEQQFNESAAVDYVISPADSNDPSQLRLVNISDEEGGIDQEKAQQVLAAIEDQGFEVAGVQRGSFNDADLVQGISVAIEGNADIINLSLGGPGAFDEELIESFGRATDQGRILVFAGGNDDRTDEDGNPLTTPPDVEGSSSVVIDERLNGLGLAVGVVDENNEIQFNNCGTARERCLVAPGIDINTTDNGGGFESVDGSSFAAPAVSGSLALLLERFPTISSNDAVEILLVSATDLGEKGVDEVFGHGLVNLERAFQPIGVASLPTGTDIDGGLATLSSSTLGLSGAFGDAFGDVAALQDGLFLDGFRRPYKANLQGNVNLASRGINFENVLVGSDIDTKSFTAPNGFNVTFALRDETNEAIDDLNNQVAQLGSAQASYEQETRLQSLKFSGEVTDGLTMTAGHNLTAGQQLAADPASASTGNLFLFTGDSFNPQYAFLGKGSGTSFTQSLSETTSFSVGFLASDPQVGDTSGEGFITQANLNHRFEGGANLGFSASFTNEANGFLGSEASGAFAESSETNSQFFTLAGTMPLSATIEALGSATVGLSDLSGVNGGLLSDLDRAVSDAFALGLVKNDVFDGKDKIGLMFSQPLRVEAGDRATFSVPTAVNADGTVVRTNEQVSLTPSGRELNLQLSYSRELASNMGVTSYALARHEPGHNEDAAPDFGAGMRFKFSF